MDESIDRKPLIERMDKLNIYPLIAKLVEGVGQISENIYTKHKHSDGYSEQFTKKIVFRKAVSEKFWRTISIKYFHSLGVKRRHE